MAYLYWIRHKSHTDMFEQGYVGITTRKAKKRWACHKAASKEQSKQHLPIYRALNKYPEDEIVFEVIVEGSEEYITDLEERLRPSVGIGWNVAQGGQATGRGRTPSDAQRERLSNAMKGKKHSDAAKAKMSAASKGVPKSESHKAKCRVANLGKKRSPEANEKQAAKIRGRIKITDEGRKSLSEHHKNLKEWERSRSRIEMWAVADELFIWMQENKNNGKRYLAKYLGLKDSAVFTIHTKLKDGWNPLEDPAWLDFKDNYEKETNEQTK